MNFDPTAGRYRPRISKQIRRASKGAAGCGSIRLTTQSALRMMLVRAGPCAPLAARAGRRPVLGVPVAKTAHAAQRRHALLVGDEAAIGAATVVAHGVIGAPRIILRPC